MFFVKRRIFELNLFEEVSLENGGWRIYRQTAQKLNHQMG
jgi:hypothetical protein